MSAETVLLIALAGVLLIAAAGLGAVAARSSRRIRTLEKHVAEWRSTANRLNAELQRLREQGAAAAPVPVPDPAASTAVPGVESAGTAAAGTPRAVIDELVHLADLASGSALEVQARRALVAAGLEESSPVPGDAFDPVRHTAANLEPSDRFDPGTVLRVERPGWRLGGTLIRTADVTVTAAPEPEEVQP